MSRAFVRFTSPTSTSNACNSILTSIGPTMPRSAAGKAIDGNEFSTW